MINLQKYPRLERLTKSSIDLKSAYNTVCDLYQDKKRISGRPVVLHCLETAEITNHFVSNPIYVTTALFHDIREDLGLSFDDVKLISGQEG